MKKKKKSNLDKKTSHRKKDSIERNTMIELVKLSMIEKECFSKMIEISFYKPTGRKVNNRFVDEWIVQTLFSLKDRLSYWIKQFEKQGIHPIPRYIDKEDKDKQPKRK